MNFLKFLRALAPGTVLYDITTNQLLISCGCRPLYKRFFKGLVLKTEIVLPWGCSVIGRDVVPKDVTLEIEQVNVKNLRNFTIIGNVKNTSRIKPYF